jgi:peptidase, C39 family
VKTLVDDYPTGFGLEPLGNAFARCGMRSVALRGSVDELLADWPKPLLLVLGSEDEARLAVLVSANDEEVILFDAEGRRRRLPIAQLADVWSGVAVVFDKEGYSPRPPEGRIRQKLQSVRLRRVCLYAFVVLATMLTLRGVLAYLPAWQGLPVVLLAAFGLALSVVAVLQSAGVESLVGRRLCHHREDDEGCGRVLTSRYAHLFGGFGWGEVGVDYFLLPLCMAAVGLSAQSLWILSIVWILSALFIPYSLYIQRVRLRSWCIICLLVLVVEALLATLGVWMLASGAACYTGLFGRPLYGLSLYFLVVAASYLYWAKWRGSVEGREYKRAFNQLRFAPPVVAALFRGEVAVPPPPGGEMMEWRLREGGQLCVLVIGLNCPVCAKWVSVLQERADASGIGRLRVVLFSPSPALQRLSAQWVELLGQVGIHEALRAFAEGFPTGWLERCSGKATESAKNSVHLQQEWCVMHGIASTPQLYVNGKELPDYYDVEDLEFLHIVSTAGIAAK